MPQVRRDGRFQAVQGVARGGDYGDQMIIYTPRDVRKEDVSEIVQLLPSGSVLVKTRRHSWVRDFYFLLGGPMNVPGYSQKRGDMVTFSVPTKFKVRR